MVAIKLRTALDDLPVGTPQAVLVPLAEATREFACRAAEIMRWPTVSMAPDLIRNGRLG